MNSSPDTLVVRLNANHRIMANKLQWKVQHRRGKRWDTDHFVASTKDILLRVLGEMDIKPTKKARAVLANMPATFRAWRVKRRGRA